MVPAVVTAVLLVAVTVFVHAAGTSALLRVMLRTHGFALAGFWAVVRMVVVLAASLVVIHLTEIAAWGVAYAWHGCFPDLETSIYFSGVTYTTVGYGELVLPKPWRVLAPVEALTGILMCGVSTGLFFAIVQRQIVRWLKTRPELEGEPPASRDE